MGNIKALFVTNEADEYSEIERAVGQVVNELQIEKFDNEAIVAMNVFVFDVIIVHTKCSLILREDFFVNKLQEYKKHIPIIILIDEDDYRYVKDISNLSGVDFCLTFDFSKDVLVELFQDCILTAIELQK
jgi:DNA-binding NarL/FixJ family response regulator